MPEAVSGAANGELKQIIVAKPQAICKAQAQNLRSPSRA